MCYPIPRQGFPGGSAGKESACNFVKFKNKIKLKKKRNANKQTKKESACNMGDLEILKSRVIALLTKVRLIKASYVWM